MGLDDGRVSEDAGRGLAARARAFCLLALAWLALDQLAKAAVVASFKTPGAPPVVLIDGYLSLTFTLNRGAAFGLFNDVAWARWLFSGVAIAALGTMLLCRRGLLLLPAIERVALALVAAGAAGNLIDRLTRGGAVVDFIHFYVARTGFVFPDFNVADIGVSVGMTIYIAHAMLTDYQAERTRPAPAAAPPPLSAEPARAEHDA